MTLYIISSLQPQGQRMSVGDRTQEVTEPLLQVYGLKITSDRDMKL